MWRYVLWRVVLIIPTITLVLVFAFLLQSLSSEDEVDRIMDIEGENKYAAHGTYIQTYSRIAKQLGLTGPDFYFSIRPDYVPGRVSRIVPLNTRRGVIQIARQTQSPDEVMRIFELIDHSFALVEDDDLRGIASDLLQLRSSKSLHDLQNRIRVINDQQYPDLTLQDNFRELSLLINKLNIKSGWVYPVVRWHGTGNRFHQLLAKGIFTGRSLVDGATVQSKIIQALRWTITLSFLSLVFIGVFTLLISYLQIIGEGSFPERFSSIAFYILYAMPLFWIATIMVVFFTTREYGAWTDWFPSVGVRIRPGQVISPWVQIGQNLDRLILPVLCMGLHALAFTTQQTKSEIKQQLEQPYILAARARGLSFIQLLRKHVFPNALVSYITIMTGRIAALLSGSIIIEYIFNIPGIGRLLFDSIYESDWPVIFGIIIIISFTTILALLLGDILLALVNPKVKSKMT